ncbi:MAG: trypsin-like peptidase domain-containing protein [Chloroflexi bacterium]|nr:trypsin-like peptidase domain-containing protein [Chloroflexota bacterium]
MSNWSRNHVLDARSLAVGVAIGGLAVALVVAIGLTLSPSRATAAVAAPGTVAAVAQSVGPAVVSVRTDQGLGSGVIYDPSGLILTNAHVIQGAQSITVGLADGRHFAGNVVGADTGFDVAVLRIEGSNLPVATLGDSANLQVGDPVVAIGNPFGFDHTLTTGVVSALNRPVSEGQGSYNQPMIQTDAAINPGNSGGPLLDINGQVMGITTLVAAPQGLPAEGLGFAVPVDTAKRIADQLIASGKVTHSGQPFLGLALADINRPDTTPGLPGQPFVPGLPGIPGSGGRRGQQPAPTPPSGVDHGALVTDVQSGGPSASAGLQVGDVIVSFDGVDIYNPDELLQRLVLHKPNDQVQVGVIRNGQQQTMSLTIGEAPVQTSQ